VKSNIILNWIQIQIYFSSDDFGINLMNNYNYNFYLFNDNDLYTNTCNQYYRGLAPFSEEETVAHNSFIKSQSFKMALNLMKFFHC